MNDTSPVSVRIVAHGAVQGVGYRHFVDVRARQLGLEGWVRNRRDGTVEAVFHGAPDAIDAIIADCRRGPAMARVTQIDQDRVAETLLAQRGAGERFSVLDTA